MHLLFMNEYNETFFRVATELLTCVRCFQKHIVAVLLPHFSCQGTAEHWLLGLLTILREAVPLRSDKQFSYLFINDIIYSLQKKKC